MANRLFFAVPVPRSQQLPLLRLQTQLEGAGRPVLASNFHITLAFLGNVCAAAQQQLLQRWQGLSLPPCQLSLNQLQLWPKAQVLALTSNECPTPLYQLAGALQRDAAKHGLHQSQHGFRPHLTLFRGAQQSPLATQHLQQPILINCNEVQLMISEQTPAGVSYQPIKRWQCYE
ncbi:RNA 2',3'-cyclic phosphodiesterase [Ferrimonas lipolytica]|uniref:RNA 2',3'-cyclic phosphodiesterase n=1 Tax=Ferrimonas lipolytica TaxID=2724191 RepID=A0A6H1UEZ6_9GAMM|nr:RNA 2',3'-cyclic phosphodiesterase [Ferrimonas lipolytica]QIZ77677.1 RNA 2',3'-cyclic phosphodiesterase [Ferrimonas lipolytica]